MSKTISCIKCGCSMTIEYDANCVLECPACLTVFTDEKTWAGIRCKRCGAILIKGKCPVNKTDCKRSAP